MDRYSFTVKVDGVDWTRDGYEDPFFEAGCDDALLAVVDDSLFLDFDREAPSFEDAVQSAIRDIERAGAKVVQHP